MYSVRANIRDHTSVSFTPHPSDFDGLKTAPSAPSGINVARNVARDVVRDVVRGVARGVSRNVSRGVSRGVGRMRQYEHLTVAGSPPLFYISHNLSVRTCLFTDKPVIFGVNPCQDYASLSVSRWILKNISDYVSFNDY